MKYLIIAGILAVGASPVVAQGAEDLVCGIAQEGARQEGREEGYKEGYRDGEQNGRNEEYLDRYARDHGATPGPTVVVVDNSMTAEMFRRMLTARLH